MDPSAHSDPQHSALDGAVDQLQLDALLVTAIATVAQETTKN